MLTLINRIAFDIIIYLTRLATAVMLFLTINFNYSDHYFLIKLTIFLVSGISAFLYFKINNSKIFSSLMLLIAMLYNPFVSFIQTDVVWLYISILCGGILAGSFVFPHYNEFDTSSVQAPGEKFIDRLQLQKAEQYYSNQLRMDPKLYPALNNLGVICFARSQFNEAITYFTNAAKLAPNSCFSYYNLGISYEYIGKKDLSKKNYISAIQLNRDFAEFYYKYGEIIVREEQLGYFPMTSKTDFKIIEGYIAFGRKRYDFEMSSYVLIDKQSASDVARLLMEKSLSAPFLKDIKPKK